MPVGARFEAHMSTLEFLEAQEPLDIVYESGTTVSAGPTFVPVPHGTTGQAVRIIGDQGITAIYGLLICADQDISVAYNGSDQALNLDANGFHTLAGTNLTAIAITNNSGFLATCAIWLVGEQAQSEPDLCYYWNLDESSGTRVAQVGGADLLLDSGVVDAVPGLIGQSLDNDQNAGKLISNANIDLPGDFTVTFWLKVNIPVDKRITGASFGVFDDDASGWFVGFTKINGNLYMDASFSVYTNGGATAVTAYDAAGELITNVELLYDSWMFFICSWNNTTKTPHLRVHTTLGTYDTDTDEVGAQVYDNPPAPLNIGRLVQPPNGSSGVGVEVSVDELGIWCRLLTEDEKTTLWNGGAGLTYPFD